MTVDKETLVTRGPHDVGGRDAGPVDRREHPLLPWEKRCQALCDVLAARQIVLVEEKRKGVEELGEELYGKLCYYERWIVAMARILLAKGILTPDEIGKKLAEL